MTAPYSRIACFIEEGPASDLALAEAVGVRAMSPGELHVVHVAARPYMFMTGFYGYFPPPLDELRAEAERWLEERVRGMADVIPVVLEGYAPRAACEYAAEAGIDLIVAAAHRGLVERAMLGGFAAYVAYHAPCPVLLVHPPTPEEGEPSGG